MICLSNVCAKLEYNPIDSRECAECKGVYNNIWSNNMEGLYLQRDITPHTVYCSQACMMSIEQATKVYGNEEIVAIYSII